MLTSRVGVFNGGWCRTLEKDSPVIGGLLRWSLGSG